MTARGPASGAGAFTLLEMLVATALLAVVAGSLYTCLHIAFRARDTAMNAVGMVRRCDAAFAFLKEDLQSAACPGGASNSLAGPFAGNPGDVGIGGRTSTPGLPTLSAGVAGLSAFGSTGDTLSFYAAATDMEANVGIGDIKRIEFGLEPLADLGGIALVRRTTTNLLSPAPLAREEVICPGVRAFSLRYYDGLAWGPIWDSNSVGNVLPLAVEVTLELAGTSTPEREGTPCRMTRVIQIPCGRAVDPNLATGPM